MSYQHLWTDLHSNIHHNQMDQLDRWCEHAREVLDFWPIAYYPMYMRRNEAGAPLEDLYPEEKIQADWEQVRQAVKRINAEGWPMFMGYEWQGCGHDGDHNVFFLDNEQPMLHPMEYQQLRDAYSHTEAIAIPHHVAYQLGSRGKNWATHDERFSPFAEIYSSHGCSENDTGPWDMERHLHMGPRTGETCYERGLERGLKVGCIASGDNHNVPAACDHGIMCVLAEGTSKEQIWEGLRAGRVYGVSRTRMKIDYTINGVPMGGTVAPGQHELNVQIEAADAIDRVELLHDNIMDEMVVHSGTWERQPLPQDQPFRIKFAVEFGWGPNPRFFKEQFEKHWHGRLEVPGKLISIEKCWNSFGQRLYNVTEDSCEFDMTTYMSTDTGHWMGPSTVKKEGFVFEAEVKLDDVIRLTVDGTLYEMPVREMLHTGKVYAQYQESEALCRATFGDIEHYRDDLVWHSAHKIRVRQAVPQAAYTMQIKRSVSLNHGSQYRLRVWLRNGDTAWVSPIFCREN